MDSTFDEIEDQIWCAQNNLRTDPDSFLPLLKAFRNGFPEGSKTWNGYLSTNEGAAAVDEAIDFIDALDGKNGAVSYLDRKAGMDQGCRDHVEQMGPGGDTGHTGLDGSDPFDRMNRYGAWQQTAGENLAYSNSPNGESYIMQLFVDDGVASRGHRVNLMKPAFGVTGVAIGEHKTYGYQVCLGYAGDYEDN